MSLKELTHTIKVDIINALNLKHLKPEELDDNEPLFAEGVGLDSVDAIELIILMERNYGVKIEEPKKGPQIFYSAQTMAEYIDKHHSQEKAT